MAEDDRFPMNEQTVTRSVTVTNPEGLHMRPARLFADMAGRFDAKIEVIKNDLRVDGKSMTHLLTLGAANGEVITIQATGHDAKAALEALLELLQRNFALDDAEPFSDQANP